MATIAQVVRQKNRLGKRKVRGMGLMAKGVNDEYVQAFEQANGWIRESR